MHVYKMCIYVYIVSSYNVAAWTRKKGKYKYEDDIPLLWQD